MVISRNTSTYRIIFKSYLREEFSELHFDAIFPLNKGKADKGLSTLRNDNCTMSQQKIHKSYSIPTSDLLTTT